MLEAVSVFLLITSSKEYIYSSSRLFYLANLFDLEYLALSLSTLERWNDFLVFCIPCSRDLKPRLFPLFCLGFIIDKPLLSNNAGGTSDELIYFYNLFYSSFCCCYLTCVCVWERERVVSRNRSASATIRVSGCALVCTAKKEKTAMTQRLIWFACLGRVLLRRGWEHYFVILLWDFDRVLLYVRKDCVSSTFDDKGNRFLSH